MEREPTPLPRLGRGAGGEGNCYLPIPVGIKKERHWGKSRGEFITHGGKRQLRPRVIRLGSGTKIEAFASQGVAKASIPFSSRARFCLFLAVDFPDDRF